jgi:putative tryptophan/tyrosine transport system substrate-binding protein
MNRRTFLRTTLASGLLAAPLAAEAQSPEKVVRIGILTLGFAPSTPPIEALRQGLGEHGYVEGRNMALEFRFAEGRTDRLPALAAGRSVDAAGRHGR